MEPHVFVCPLSQVPQAVRTLKPSHLITLLDPQAAMETPAGLVPERHLRLGVHDVQELVEDMTHPTEDHVGDIIAFISSWERKAPLLVHCWAGISRSTAAAFITLCHFNEEGREAELARLLRRRAPHAHPNKLMVRHADRLMGRKGRMSAAVEALGPGEIMWEGRLFGVPLYPGKAR